LNAYSVQNVVTYDTIIDFENPDEKLRPGETAYVTIPTGNATNVVLIPNTSLTFTPDLPRAQLQALYKQYNISREASTTHLGGWQVLWKLGSDKKPLPLAVQCGITDFNNTQLVKGELNEGDVLITGQQSTGTSSATPRSAISTGATGGRGPGR
jgi:HlyD family secretion protein